MSTSTGRACLAILVLLWAASSGDFSRRALAQDGAEPPNIIFIMADDLGYGDLGCYGQKSILTPHIDRMAAEGMKFTNFYAGSTVCAPSRCALMTGLHTGHCRIRGNSRVSLLPEDVTVAEVLKAAGYRTALFGKWGLGEPGTTGIPNRQGFDTWFGYLNQRHAHNYHPYYLWRNEERVILEGNLDGNRKDYTHDLFTAEALKYIRERGEGSAERPFFLYLSYTIPHANNELGGQTGNGMEVPSVRPYASEPWPRVERNMAAMVTRLDADVGKIMALLKEVGLDEKTIVFFTSDNGPHHEGGHDDTFFESSGPLRGLKRDLYDGGIRVPMIVRWPGRIEAGAVSDQVWAFWDFLPTAAGLAGAEPPGGIDGISMVPVLRGEPQRNHEFLYWEFHEGGFLQGVRMDNWKAVWKRTGRGATERLELYDLSSDIGEMNNVSARQPDVVRKIERYLESARTASEAWPVDLP